MSDQNVNTSAEPKGRNGLLIGDVIWYIALWADLQRDERIGNPEISDGLRLLADGLKPHKSRPVSELNGLQLGPKAQHPRKARKPPAELPQDLGALPCDAINEILNDEKYLKSQIVELGACRFGIPRSKLNRLPRPQAIASVRAAVDHERSLAAIAEQAKRAGERRSA